jgi:hypothetical protein
MAQKEKTPEEIRAERIANLKDPQAIENIKKIEQERTVELAKLREDQRQNLEKRVEQIAQQREATRNGPQYTPPGMKDGPVIDKDDKQKLRDDARAEVYRQMKGQDRTVDMRFDRKVDRELDAADRRQERAQGYPLERDTTLDRSSR